MTRTYALSIAGLPYLLTTGPLATLPTSSSPLWWCGEAGVEIAPGFLDVRGLRLSERARPLDGTLDVAALTLRLRDAKASSGMAAALLWLGWRSVSFVERLSGDQRVIVLEEAIERFVSNGLRGVVADVPQTLFYEQETVGSAAAYLGRHVPQQHVPAPIAMPSRVERMWRASIPAIPRSMAPSPSRCAGWIASASPIR